MGMDASSEANDTDRTRSMYILAMVNVAIWAIAIVALAFVIDDYPGARGMFPILGGGVAVGISLIATIGRPR